MNRKHVVLLMAAALAVFILAMLSMLVWVLVNTPAPFNDCPCHL